jgi:hypothetical protein
MKYKGRRGCKRKKRDGAGEVRWLAAQYRSPGCSGNLASLQCQFGCLVSQGKHLPTHTYTPWHHVAHTSPRFAVYLFLHELKSQVWYEPHFMGTPVRAGSLPTAGRMPCGWFSSGIPYVNGGSLQSLFLLPKIL